MRRTRRPVGLLVAAALAAFVSSGCFVVAGFALGAARGTAGGVPAGMGEPIPPGVAPGHLAQLRGPWQATPIPLDPALVVAAERACRANQGMPVGAPPGGGPGAGGLTPAHVLRVADARGEGVITLVFESPDGSATCVSQVGEGILIPGEGGASAGGAAPPLPPDGLRIQGSGSSLILGLQQSSVEGQVGGNVAAVRVIAEGGAVEASIGGGWFVAWWPAAEQPVLVEAYDAAGTKIAEQKL